MEAEEWNALLKLGLETKLEEWWWEMSYAQFHDVFTGSHEDITYLDLINRLQTVAAGARSAVEDTFSLPGNTSSAVCLNALPYHRKEWVELPGGEGREVAVRQGDRDLPVEYEGDRAFCQVDVPPVSATNLSVQWGQPRPMPAVDLGQPCESCVLENGRITLSLHRKKGIVSLAAPELLMAQVKDFLVVQEDKGSLQIEDVLGEELSVMDGSAQLYYRENAMGQYGLYRGEFQGMHWNQGENRLQWSVEFCLPKEGAGIAVKIWVDWKGEATRIRFRVPHLVDSSLGIYEIPFGTVRRSTYDGHATAKGEWPAHRFVTIEDQKKGLALVNRGVAGVELAGNAFETTLLRAYPDQPGVWVPVTPLSSQHGQHQYEFLLVPYHPGAVDQVAQTAQRWNQPITVLPGSCGESWAGESFLDIGPSNLVLSSVKTADDGSGDMILRYYETCGRNTEGQVFVRGGKEIWLSDVTEKSVTRLAQGETTAIRCRPYEIQTLRVKR